MKSWYSDVGSNYVPKKNSWRQEAENKFSKFVFTTVLFITRRLLTYAYIPRSDETDVYKTFIKYLQL